MFAVDMAQPEIHTKPYLYIVKAVCIFRLNLHDCFSTVNSHLSPPTTRHRRLQKEVILTEVLCKYIPRHHHHLHGHKVVTGHAMLKILGVKCSMSLIFPSTDSVAFLWSACWHLSIWPCHLLARAGMPHYHAVHACVHLHYRYTRPERRLQLTGKKK